MVTQSRGTEEASPPDTELHPKVSILLNVCSLDKVPKEVSPPDTELHPIVSILLNGCSLDKVPK